MSYTIDNYSEVPHSLLANTKLWSTQFPTSATLIYDATAVWIYTNLQKYINQQKYLNTDIQN